MTLTELVGLLDILHQLTSAKADLDQKYFEQFVRPLWEAFSIVHDDYKKTFRQYIADVLDPNFDITTLKEKVRQDSFFSEDLRTKVWEMAKHIPPAFPKTATSLLADFLFQVHDYILCGLINVDPHEPTTLYRDEGHLLNYSRYEVTIRLSRAGATTNPTELQQFLERLVHQMQIHYRLVASAYETLKKDLLT